MTFEVAAFGGSLLLAFATFEGSLLLGGRYFGNFTVVVTHCFSTIMKRDE